jgi:hypothetical protein
MNSQASISCRGTHDFKSGHLSIGTYRKYGKADHIGVFESLIKGSVLAR